MTRQLWTVSLVAAMVLGMTACDVPITSDSTEPGMSYRSLERLPDLSGWWAWQFTSDDQPFHGSVPDAYRHAPFTPDIAAIVQAELSKAAENARKAASGESFVPDDKYDKARYCRPPEFRGAMELALFEVLYTPGRVTLINERGLVRRIDLNRQLPAEVDVSNAGTSVGHWEGQALVVETVRKIVRGRAPFISHVTERLTLKEPDLLQIDLVWTAPAVLTKPYEHTYLYRRDRQHEFQEFTDCVDYDRYGDAATGKQRFDLTPPSDLPPPPAD